jgi:PAS domain S-box-containing protein
VEAIFVCDKGGTVIRASRAVERLCDGSPLSRPFAEVFPLRRNDSNPFQLAPVLSGQTLLNVDVALARKEHRVDFILNAGPVVRGDEVVGCVVVLTDITERKLAEAALKESEARLAGIVDSAMDGIITVDARERVLVFNAAAESLFDCPAADAIGQPLARFLPASLGTSLEGKRPSPEHAGAPDCGPGGPIPIKGLRATGEVVPFEASISHTDVNGHSLSTIILRDLSERVRTEELRVQLEAQIRLAQKMEALGTLAGGIAHDFNNILGAIIGNTELVRQDVTANRAATESLDEIRKACLRAKSLVQRILTFGSQRQEPQRVIALRPAVEEALKLLRATLPAGVEIVATFGRGVPTVAADPTHIVQALINLCTNAWHAMEGHVGIIQVGLDDITIDAREASRDVSLRPGHFARLSVTDAGSGMDAVTLQRIFDPFFTTKTVGKGTGLGLCVVHGIVKAHNGLITVRSAPGKGTTFFLYFPAVEAAAEIAAPEAAVAGPRPDGGRRHVLYLDDEEQLVSLVKRMLERHGYRVTGFTRPEEALAAVRADPGQFDLFVTDFNMPEMSGLEVARELSRLRPSLPVVLASGYITDALRAEAPLAGVRQLVYKPNTVEELCDVVQRFTGTTGPSEESVAVVS